jgi:hypothetical protein
MNVAGKVGPGRDGPMFDEDVNDPASTPLTA